MACARAGCVVVAGLVAMGLFVAGCDIDESPPAKDAGGLVYKDEAPRPVPAGPAVEREGWPTEGEAKAAIFKVEFGIHASQTNKEVWKVKDMKHEVKSVQFGQKTIQKQMNFGAQAITVYPVKILYTRVTDYEHKAATREEVGADGVWFLYRDSFGQWTGKYGSE